MADLRRQYHAKNPFTTQSNTQDIQNELDKLLGDAYDCRHISSLKNDFLEACYQRLDPDQSWEELVRTHEDYNASWTSKKKRLATALRMLITNQIGWPLHVGLAGFKRKYLAGILAAIEASDNGISRNDDHAPVTLPPDFDLDLLSTDPPERTRPEPPFSIELPFSESIKADATSYLKERHIDPTSDDHHVVYVIDCTPDPENERNTITYARRFAQAKHLGGEALTEKEEAALALNESRGILYVGYSHEFPHRMERHYHGVSRGSAVFINLHKPERLLELNEYESDGRARDAEVQRYDELKRKTDWYVYQA